MKEIVELYLFCSACLWLSIVFAWNGVERVITHFESEEVAERVLEKREFLSRNVLRYVNNQLNEGRILVIWSVVCYWMGIFLFFVMTICVAFKIVLPALSDINLTIFLIFTGIQMFSSCIPRDICIIRWNEQDEKRKTKIKLHEKEKHYYQQLRTWKLAPDDPFMPLKQKEERLTTTAMRISDSATHIRNMVAANNWNSYLGMTEEMDGLYDRLKQVEQRLYEIGSKKDISFYSDYWVLTKWHARRFDEEKQQWDNGASRKKQRCLKK